MTNAATRWPIYAKTSERTSLESARKFRAKNAEGALTSDTIESISTASMFPFAYFTRVYSTLSYFLRRNILPKRSVNCSKVQLALRKLVRNSTWKWERLRREIFFSFSFFALSLSFSFSLSSTKDKSSFSRRLILTLRRSRRNHRRRTTITQRTTRRARSSYRSRYPRSQGKPWSRPRLRNCSNASASSYTGNAPV